MVTVSLSCTAFEI